MVRNPQIKRQKTNVTANLVLPAPRISSVGVQSLNLVDQRTFSWPDESDKKRQPLAEESEVATLGNESPDTAISQEQTVNQNQTGPVLWRRKGNQTCPNPMCKVLIRLRKNQWANCLAQKEWKRRYTIWEEYTQIVFRMTWYLFLPRKPLRAYGLSSFRIHIKTLRNSGGRRVYMFNIPDFSLAPCLCKQAGLDFVSAW